MTEKSKTKKICRLCDKKPALEEHTFPSMCSNCKQKIINHKEEES